MNDDMKMPVDAKLLAIFWRLAEGNENSRIESTKLLLDTLKNKQTKKDEHFSEELGYCLKRLVRGLASDRQFARLGYSVALVELLKAFDQISNKDVLKCIDNDLKIQKAESKREISDFTFGRALAYIAIIQSGRMLESKAVAKEIFDGLLTIQREKIPLHLICTQGLVQLIAQADDKTFKKALFPNLNDLLSGWEGCTPDRLSLLLASSKYHPTYVDDKFLAERWRKKRILHKGNLADVAEIMTQSTCDHPAIHISCYQLIEAALENETTFELFWKEVIEGKLLPSQPSRKNLVFRLLEHAITLCTTSKQVEIVLSHDTLKCIIYNLTNQQQTLNSAAKRLTENVTKNFDNWKSRPDLQLTTLSAFLRPPSSMRLDVIAKTKTISNIVSKLNMGASSDFRALLMDVFIGTDVFNNEKQLDLDARRRWSLQHLSLMLLQPSVASDDDWHLSLLQFFFLHAFFSVTKSSSSIRHCDKQLVSELSPAIRHSLQDTFFKSLQRLATFNPVKCSKKNWKGYIDILRSLINYANKLLRKQKIAMPVTAMTDKVTEAWNKVVDTVNDIQQKVEANSETETRNELLAFQLMFLHFGLQLFTATASQVTEALKDLHLCYDKAFEMGHKKTNGNGLDKGSDDLEEPTWIEVIVELLLSLLSQESHLVRVVVSIVFSMLCPHITPEVLTLIIDVLKPTTAAESDDEEGPLTFEDNDDVEMDQSEGSGGSANASSSDGDKKSTDVEDEKMSSDEDEEIKVDEDEEESSKKMRSEVKLALGSAGVDSNDESIDEDVSDSEMMKHDEALVAAFRSMKKGSKKEEKEREMQLKNFRLRVLDLISTFIQHTSSTEMLLDLLVPLLELTEFGMKAKSNREVGDKAQDCLRILCKTKKVIVDTKTKRSLAQLFENLLVLSTKVTGIPLVKEVARACLFVLRMIIVNNNPPSSENATDQNETLSKPSKHKKDLLKKVEEYLRINLKEFCTNRKSLLNAVLFETIFQSQPIIALPLTDDMACYLADADIRIYCRTRVCGMVASLLSFMAKTIGDSAWRTYALKLGSILIVIITDQCSEEAIKTKFLFEILAALNRLLISCSEDLLKEIVPLEFLDKIETIKKKNLNTDIRRMCSRITAHLEAKFKVKKAKKERRSKSEEGRGDEFNKDEESVDGKQLIKEESELKQRNGTSAIKRAKKGIQGKREKHMKNKEVEEKEESELQERNGPAAPKRVRKETEEKKEKHKKKKKRTEEEGKEQNSVNGTIVTDNEKT